MRILVTGGAGFIGSHVVDAYVRLGHEVIVVDDLSSGRREKVNPGCRFSELDIRSADLGDLFLDFQPELVNHQAAQLSVSYSVRHPAEDADINIAGTINVLQQSVAAGVEKVIFASSGGTVYGDADVFPTPEGAPFRPSTPYGISKATCESYVQFFERHHGLAYTILRYSNVYGPRQSAAGEAGVVALFCDAILGGSRPTLYGARAAGDEGCTRDYVYVGEVADANVAALSAGDGTTVNISTSVETTTRDLLSLVVQALDRPGVQPDECGPRAGDLSRSVLDNALAMKTLDWSPTTSVQEGVARTVSDLLPRAA